MVDLLSIHFVVYLLIPTSNHNSHEIRCNLQTVVYLLIPTSNHNCWRNFKPFKPLYIFWFLHQTTTPRWQAYVGFSCISFDSYIKPQLFIKDSVYSQVVYLLIPTSNHNACRRRSSLMPVVYLLIPTSNHNLWMVWCYSLTLYIFWFLHQTTTSDLKHWSYTALYIFWFLHQTTTIS